MLRVFPRQDPIHGFLGRLADPEQCLNAHLAFAPFYSGELALTQPNERGEFFLGGVVAPDFAQPASDTNPVKANGGFFVFSSRVFRLLLSG